jgi:hypothetical protein
MKAENRHWRSHVLLLTLISCAFAAIPFAMRGLSTEIAEIVAAIIFLSTLVAYMLVMKLCGVQGEMFPTRNRP